MSKVLWRSALTVALLLVTVGFVWGQSSIAVRTSGGMKYLATSDGMTLYYFAKDAAGKSSCVGACAKFWPPFHAPSISPTAGIKASAIGSITRPDGSMQTTYRGWPLYTFAGDKKAGQTNGEGFRGTWFVASVPFYTVMTGDSSKAGGNYLVSAGGKTLYYFKKDSPGKSVCNGGCAKLWPPFDVSSIHVPGDLHASSFSTITRADGSQQVTYKGYPLYFFAQDQHRGQLRGNGFYHVWSVVDPAQFNPSGASS